MVGLGRDHSPVVAAPERAAREAAATAPTNEALSGHREAVVVRAGIEGACPTLTLERRVDVGGSGVREGGSGIEAGPARTGEG